MHYFSPAHALHTYSKWDFISYLIKIMKRFLIIIFVPLRTYQIWVAFFFLHKWERRCGNSKTIVIDFIWSIRIDLFFVCQIHRLVVFSSNIKKFFVFFWFFVTFIGFNKIYLQMCFDNSWIKSQIQSNKNTKRERQQQQHKIVEKQANNRHSTIQRGIEDDE